MKAKLSLKKLRRKLPKTIPYVWGPYQKAITKREVLLAIKENRFISPRYARKNWNVKKQRQMHIERIAYLVVKGWRGRPDINCRDVVRGRQMHISDGNHRFAAALIRNDEFVDVSLWSDGINPRKDMYEFMERFGV